MSKKSSENGQKDNRITMWITEEDGLTEEEADKNYEILQERIRCFTHGRKYVLDRKEDAIYFSFPEEILYYADPSYIVDSFLLHWGSFRLNTEDIQLTLDCEDFLSVEKTKDGSLKFIFSDIVLSFIEENVSEEEAKILPLNSLNYGLDLLLEKGEDDAYYLTYDESDLLYGNEEVFIYNVTHPSFDADYKCYQEKTVAWQQDEELFGKYQHKVSDLKSDAIYCQYSESESKYPYDLIRKLDNLIKSRLDSLEVPYAYGETSDGIGILIERNPLTKNEMSFMSKEGIPKVLYDGYTPEDTSCVLSKEWNDYEECFEITLTDKEYRRLKEWRKHSDKPVYLSFDKYSDIVAVLDESQSEQEDVLRFIPQKMTKKRKNYYRQVMLDEYLDGSYNLDFCKKDGKFNTAELYADNPYLGQKEEEITDELRKIFPEGQINYNNLEDFVEGLEINIYLNREKSSYDATCMLEDVRTFIDHVSPEIQLWSDIISIYPFEKDSDKENYIEVATSKNNGKIDLIYIFLHGKKLGEYQDELMDDIEQNRFWEKHNVMMW